MNLPTSVLAFSLLQAANLMPYHEKLARTAAKLEYKDMREKVQKIFGETGDNVVDCVPVKTEDILYTDNGRSVGFRRNNSRGRGNTFRGGKKTPFSFLFNRSNPIASDGSVMRCHNCESIQHFASACPHGKVKEESNLTVHVILLTEETNGYQKEDQFAECLDAKQHNLIKVK